MELQRVGMSLKLDEEYVSLDPAKLNHASLVVPTAQAAKSTSEPDWLPVLTSHLQRLYTSPLEGDPGSQPQGGTGRLQTSGGGGCRQGVPCSLWGKPADDEVKSRVCSCSLRALAAVFPTAPHPIMPHTWCSARTWTKWAL